MLVLEAFTKERTRLGIDFEDPVTERARARMLERLGAMDEKDWGLDDIHDRLQQVAVSVLQGAKDSMRR